MTKQVLSPEGLEEVKKTIIIDLKERMKPHQMKELNACMERFEECEAPDIVVRKFLDILRYWRQDSCDTIRAIFREACVLHGFTKPFESDGRDRFIRPVCLDVNSGNRDDDGSETPEEEQCYRRGFSQGANQIFQMFRDRVPETKIHAFLGEIAVWRTQCVQTMNCPPGLEESVNDGVIE
jgi:hypothetical protein